jgi:hypothetical protein
MSSEDDSGEDFKVINGRYLGINNNLPFPPSQTPISIRASVWSTSFAAPFTEF